MDIGIIFLKLAVATICGAIIGWEREIRDKAAGLRTHILVCLGACLFGIIGLSVAAEYKNVDILRLAQGLLIGIGFLGAGVIAREGATIKGLTTAAGIWVMGAIGLGVGLGQYVVSFLGTLFAFLTFVMFGKVERHIKK